MSGTISRAIVASNWELRVQLSEYWSVKTELGLAASR